jgi:hypothetical protein
MSGTHDGIPLSDDPLDDIQAASDLLQSARARHQMATAQLYAAEQDVQFHVGRLIGQQRREAREGE